MRLKMTIKSRKELLAALRPMYAQVTWKEKQQVLDGFVAATGYCRKHAIVLLNGKSNQTVEVPLHRSRKYDAEVLEALITVWKASNRICSKRLIPFLPTIIGSLEKFGHLNISDAAREKLLCVSHSTADRLLKQERKKYSKRKSTTKPGYLLKKHIPIRTYSDWSDVRPGFFEADLVAHGGSSASGLFLNTLTMTDIATGWTECSALIYKSESSVLRSFALIQKMLPFQMQGIDTDNGSEFINHGVLNWCQNEKITFTRSREYKKNDQAHVEEKNGSIVRRLIGYDRYEGEDSWRTLTRLYEVARLYINFFQPSLKLSSKEREGGNVKRIYERAATPYQRLMESVHVSLGAKQELERQFESLDPVDLLTKMEALQSEFWSTAVTVQESASQAAIKQLVKATVALKQSDSPRASIELRTTKRPRKSRIWMPTLTYAGNKKGKKSNLDEVWDEVCSELAGNPDLHPREILQFLMERYPNKFRKTQVSTIADRLRNWRHENSRPIEFKRLKPGKKTNIDNVWLLALQVLEEQPNISSRGLHRCLLERFPAVVGAGQRTSIMNRLKIWREENSEKLEVVNTKELNISIFDEALQVVSQIQRK